MLQNKKRNKKGSVGIGRRILAFAMMLAVMFSALQLYAFAAEVGYDDIKNDDTEALREQIEKYAALAEAAAAKIAEANEEKTDALAAKALYDDMHNIYTEQLALLERQRQALEDDFDELEAETARLEAEYLQSYENFMDLLRMTYESGTSEYIALILGAEDLVDLLSRIERVSSMISYNSRLMKRAERAKEELELKKAELDESRQKLDDAAKRINEKEAELEKWDDENEALLAELEAKIKADTNEAEEYRSALDKANDEFDELVARMIAEEQERQRKLEEELKQKQLEEAERQRLELERIQQEEMEKESAAQDYVWPLPTNYARITSWFDEYRNLTEIGYKDTHGGMDIAAPNGTPIYAVKTGRVIISGWVSGYGNCVMIDHGNGVVSIYGHASKLLCNVGDIVKQGQTIALVGLTGITTGYHLHIEFRLNSKRVEPLDYISIP